MTKSKKTKQQIRARIVKRILIVAIIIFLLLLIVGIWFPVWAVNQLFDQLLG